MRLYIDELGANHVVKNTFSFPIDPENVPLNQTKLFQEYDILDIGKVMKPYGDDLDRIEITVMLLGPDRENLTQDYRTPNEIDQIITTWKKQGTKLRILLSETNIYMDAYIEQYNLTHLNSFKDAEASITLIEAKDIIVTSTTVTPKTYRAVQNKPTTYTTKANDTPWTVAKAVTQDPNNASGVVRNNPNVKRVAGSYAAGQVLNVGGSLYARAE